MQWYWVVTMAVIAFYGGFVLAALLRSATISDRAEAILDRAEKDTSGSKKGHYLVQGPTRQVLESPWPTLAPHQEGEVDVQHRLTAEAIRH